MLSFKDLVLTCPKNMWIGFALESQGDEPAIAPLTSGWHEYGPSPANSGRTPLALIGNVVWLDPSVDLNGTTQGKPLIHFSEFLDVTVHRTQGLKYIDCLPRQEVRT